MKLAFGRWRFVHQNKFFFQLHMWGYHGDIMGISWGYHVDIMEIGSGWVYRMRLVSLGGGHPKSRICYRSMSPGTPDMKNTPQKPGLNTGWGPRSSSRSGALFQWLKKLCFMLDITGLFHGLETNKHHSGAPSGDVQIFGTT